MGKQKPKQQDHVNNNYVKQSQNELKFILGPFSPKNEGYANNGNYNCYMNQQGNRNVNKEQGYYYNRNYDNVSHGQYNNYQKKSNVTHVNNNYREYGDMN